LQDNLNDDGFRDSDENLDSDVENEHPQEEGEEKGGNNEKDINLI
jgi:hypothetical protein